MKIVVISPHRDDVAFSLSLAVAGWLQQGHEVEVVCCFTQTAYAPLAAAAPQGPERVKWISALRQGEDEAWADAILRLSGRPLNNSAKGKLRMVDRTLRDAPLRLGVAIERVCSTAPKAGDAVGHIIATYIAGCGPQALLLPLAVGTHVDHVTARDAGICALRALRSECACAFYEDLPYATRPGAADELGAVADATTLRLLCGFVGLAGDANAAEAQKLRLISCYRSQVTAEEMQTIAAFCQRYGGRERVWANAAFLASDLVTDRQERPEATLI